MIVYFACSPLGWPGSAGSVVGFSVLFCIVLVTVHRLYPSSSPLCSGQLSLFLSLSFIVAVLVSPLSLSLYIVIVISIILILPLHFCLTPPVCVIFEVWYMIDFGH
jgi:hypothetical protein